MRTHTVKFLRHHDEMTRAWRRGVLNEAGRKACVRNVHLFGDRKFNAAWVRHNERAILAGPTQGAGPKTGGGLGEYIRNSLRT